MSVRSLLAVCALLCAAPGWAQSYVASGATAPYAPLANPTVPTLNGDPDTGWATVPLGFAFPYFGRTYTSLTVTTNGMAYLEPSPGTASYPANMRLGSGAAPNGVFAPFWDDLEGSNPSSRLAWETKSTATGQVLTVEWRDWNHWASTATWKLSFQLRLYESGVVEFHYGPITGAGPTLSATIGIEDPLGTTAVEGKGCGPDGIACTAYSVSPNEVLRFGPGPNTVDLIAGMLELDAVTEANGLLTLQTRLEVSNFGSDPANGVTWALLLSSDTVADPGDLPLSPASHGPFAVDALGTVTQVATSTIATPPPGAWYVLAVIDPGDLIAETDETNNVASISAPLISGVDLVAQAVTVDVAGAGPGETVTNTLVFANAGLDPAGAVGWKLWLSADTTFQPTQDLLVQAGTLNVAGGQTVTHPVTYALPPHLPSGSYWFVLQLDDGPAPGAVPEFSDANNVVFAAKPFSSIQADLEVGPVSVRDALFFGEPARFEATVHNVGGAVARDFTVVFHLSDNDSLNVLSDPEIGESAPVTLQPGAAIDVDLTASVPTHSPGGHPLVPGRWYVFAVAYANGHFVELSQQNNVAHTPWLIVRDPGPDLRPTGVFAPDPLAAGESFPIRRVLRNDGHLDAGPAGYAYYLSKNAILSPDDVRLSIVHGTGTVALSRGEVDATTDWIRVPPDVVPGAYWLGVLIDGEGVVPEIDETNNGLAGQEVTVVSPAFTFPDQPLPDAIVGRPYRAGLLAWGGQGPYAFSIIAGELPPGLTLSSAGQLEGTPHALGLFPITLELRDATDQTIRRREVLRSVENLGGVSILTTRLPAPVADAAYEVWLGAQGGVVPYRWSIENGALPAGLALDATGRLHGVPMGEVGTVHDFELRVVDAVGSSAVQRFELQVSAPGDLYIDAPSTQQAVIGNGVALDLVARRAGGVSVEGPVSWSLLSHLPEGLRLEPSGEVLIVRGEPKQLGAYPLLFGATDAASRVATRRILLQVHPTAIGLRSTLPVRAAPGEVVAGEIRFAFDGITGGTFALQSGTLPPGLLLSADGKVTGTIPEDAPDGLHTFTVRGQSSTGVMALGTFALEIGTPGAQSGGCGCAGSPGGQGEGALYVLGGLALLLRRRTPGRCSVG